MGPQLFPRERPGLDYNLNWSLADDSVTPRGDAFRNASLQQLLMYAPGKVTKSNKVLTAALPVAAKSINYATDNYAGLETLDLDRFDAKFEAVRLLCVLYPRLSPSILVLHAGSRAVL